MLMLMAPALASLLSAASPQADYAEPYRILQQANLRLDPELAATAYASDAALIFEYPGRPREEFRGRAAIRASYARTFGQVEQGASIELQFRFGPAGPGAEHHSGAYRVKTRAADREIIAYGRFSVRMVRENGHWRFAEDRGTPATTSDFDQLPAIDLGAATYP